MNTVPLQLSMLLLTAGAGVGVTAWAARRSLVPRSAAIASASATAEAVVVGEDSTVLRPWARRAPFRRSRQPSAVRYDAQALLAPMNAPAAPTPPRPTLWLRGLVWGQTPAAIIEGVPGTDGPRLIRAGDSVGPLRVRSISATQVVVSGLDTTWRLVLPRSMP
jgi:hypothetical protein